MSNVKITTGQYVKIEQRVASVSDRVFAQILDCIFMWIYLTIVTMIFVTISIPYAGTKYDTVIMILYFVAITPFIFYHLIFEYFFNGASPGKKILKLKVANVDGSSPTLGAYIMRWMMFMLECMMMPGIALLCIIFNKKGQRLGDMMAGTMVIKAEEYNRHIIVNLNYFGYVNENYRPTYPEVATLSMRQAEVIQETLMNINSNREYYINQLSLKIMDYLKIPPLVNGSAEKFLDTLLNDYRYYSSTIEI